MDMSQQQDLELLEFLCELARDCRKHLNQAHRLLDKLDMKLNAWTMQLRPKKLSLLAAAAVILRQGKNPMNARELVTAIEAAGLWQRRNGKTPDATLASKINTEIRDKGSKARFKRTAPGCWKAAK